MTRGKLVFIGENKDMYVSQEFNGGMYVACHGKNILARYEEGFKSLEEFEKYLDGFNKKHFQYEEGSKAYKIDSETSTVNCYRDFQCFNCPEKDCNINFDFAGCTDIFNVTLYRYYSDYMYLYNGSGESLEMLAKNAAIKIEDGGYAVFNFEEFSYEHSKKYVILKESETYDEELQLRKLREDFNCTEEEIDEIQKLDYSKKILSVIDDVEEYASNFLAEWSFPEFIDNYIDKEKLGRDLLKEDEKYIQLESGRIFEISPDA